MAWVILKDQKSKKTAVWRRSFFYDEKLKEVFMPADFYGKGNIYAFCASVDNEPLFFHKNHVFFRLKYMIAIKKDQTKELKELKKLEKHVKLLVKMEAKK